ncbi:hypothetical protein [Leptolyngbya phage Lsp-JY19]
MKKLHVVAMCCALAACSSGTQSPKPDEATLAFEACKLVMAKFAKNPSGAVVRHVRPSGSGRNFRFDWGHGDGLAFQNGFGALVDQRGHCHIADGGLQTASLNGQGLSGAGLTLAKVEVASFYVDAITGRR